MNFKTLKAAALATAMLAGGASFARADVIPYPNPGTVNPVIYSFTAHATGDVVGYFTGSTASYEELVGLFINGTLSSAGFGLDNHSSSIGQSFDFGSVTAGDSLVFAINVISPAIGPYAYSDPSLNGPYDGGVGINHVYSVPYTATNPVYPGVPVGTYVAFEDLQGGGDLNYFDETYVFTNVNSVQTPEPAALALLGTAALGLLAVRRRAR